jgi:hypothetical protein
MPLRLGALQDALLDAGASPEKAKQAAEELATYERLDTRVTLLTWMVGFNLGLTLLMLGILLNILTRLS